MNMMGQLPSVRISGENNDMLGSLRRMEEEVVQTIGGIKKQSGADMTNWHGAWRHNPVVNGSMACVAQTMIQTINPPRIDEEGHYVVEDDDDEQLDEESKILGFKTIRLLRHVKEEDDERVAKWLTERLPCARFLINIRSGVAQQAKSFSTNFHHDNAEEQLRDWNRRMRNLYRTLGPSRAYLLDSAKWFADVSYLNDVLPWLGYSDECHFNKVLQYNTEHGSGHGDVDTSDLMIDGSKCRYAAGDVDER